MGNGRDRKGGKCNGYGTSFHERQPSRVGFVPCIAQDSIMKAKDWKTASGWKDRGQQLSVEFGVWLRVLLRWMRLYL